MARDGRDATDPLFLQIKEATASVLEAYLPKSRFRQHGQRVVEGQRMMQPASDTYLGASDAFDKSITDFSQRYADQNEQDYEDFVKAIKSGRLQAVEGV